MDATSFLLPSFDKNSDRSNNNSAFIAERNFFFPSLHYYSNEEVHHFTARLIFHALTKVSHDGKKVILNNENDFILWQNLELITPNICWLMKAFICIQRQHIQ